MKPDSAAADMLKGFMSTPGLHTGVSFFFFFSSFLFIFLVSFCSFFLTFISLFYFFFSFLIIFITGDALEKMKNRKLIRGLIEDMKKEYPEIHKIMIEERDQHLTKSLRGCKGKVIMGMFLPFFYFVCLVSFSFFVC